MDDNYTCTDSASLADGTATLHLTCHDEQNFLWYAEEAFHTRSYDLIVTRSLEGENIHITVRIVGTAIQFDLVYFSGGSDRLPRIISLTVSPVGSAVPSSDSFGTNGIIVIWNWDTITVYPFAFTSSSLTEASATLSQRRQPTFSQSFMVAD